MGGGNVNHDAPRNGLTLSFDVSARTWLAAAKADPCGLQSTDIPASPHSLKRATSSHDPARYLRHHSNNAAGGSLSHFRCNAGHFRGLC